jgi:phage terminase large subunit-like protein
VITGTMARKNPITTLISTAGYLPEGFCAQMVETAARILRKEAEDDTFWIQIYRMDNGDEKLEPGNWTKPNPSIGELFSLDFLIQNWNSVKNLPISKRGFITMNLNEFVFGLENWIPEEDIEACFVEKRPDWITQGCDMFVGFDLSSVSDLTSVAYLFHEDNKFYLEVDSFTTPNEEKMIKGSTDIRPWIEGGYIKLCSSRVIDYDYVFDTIRRKSDGFNVVAIRYDLWNSTDLVKKLQETYGGVSVQPLKQYGLAINQSSKNFERKILEKQIQIQKNPVLRWNLRNVVIKEDEKGNIKLAKNTNADPIDGGIATIMALGAWASVYLSLYEA